MESGVLIAVSVSGFLLLLLLIILVCIFKQRKEKRRRMNVTKDEENQDYGYDYFDPNATMEVEDTNDYYSSGLVNHYCSTNLSFTFISIAKRCS